MSVHINWTNTRTLVLGSCFSQKTKNKVSIHPHIDCAQQELVAMCQSKRTTFSSSNKSTGRKKKDDWCHISSIHWLRTNALYTDCVPMNKCSTNTKTYNTCNIIIPNENQLEKHSSGSVFFFSFMEAIGECYPMRNGVHKTLVIKWKASCNEILVSIQWTKKKKKNVCLHFSYVRFFSICLLLSSSNVRFIRSSKIDHFSSKVLILSPKSIKPIDYIIHSWILWLTSIAFDLQNDGEWYAIYMRGI